MSDTEHRAGEGWTQMWAVRAIVAYLRRRAELDDTPPRVREMCLWEAVRNLGTLIQEDLTSLPMHHDSSGDPFVEFSGLSICAQRMDWRMRTRTRCWPQILARCPGCGRDYLSRPIRNFEDLGSVLVWMHRSESGKIEGDRSTARDCIEAEDAARLRDDRDRP